MMWLKGANGYLGANETAAHMVEQCIRRTIYMPLVVEIKGHLGGPAMGK